MNKQAKARIIFSALAGAASLLCAPTIRADDSSSNLAADWSYPDAPCSKPSAPPPPPQLGTIAAVNQYQLMIESYNKRSSAYTQCVNAYLDKANQDIQRIQQKMNAAVAAANTP